MHRQGVLAAIVLCLAALPALASLHAQQPVSRLKGRVLNERGIEDEDRPLYSIREGIVCIPRGTVIPDGAVI